MICLLCNMVYMLLPKQMLLFIVGKYFEALHKLLFVYIQTWLICKVDQTPWKFSSDFVIVQEFLGRIYSRFLRDAQV